MESDIDKDQHVTSKWSPFPPAIVKGNVVFKIDRTLSAVGMSRYSLQLSYSSMAAW